MIIMKLVLMINSFLSIWLTDMVNIPHCWSPQRGLGIILVPMLTTAAIGQVIGSIWQRIKLFNLRVCCHSELVIGMVPNAVA